jgi:hypothetical protein
MYGARLACLQKSNSGDCLSRSEHIPQPFRIRAALCGSSFQQA